MPFFCRLLTLLLDQETNGTMNKSYFVPLASLGELLSRVVEIYKKGFGAFLLMAVIPVAVQIAADVAGSVHPLVQLLASAAAHLASVLSRATTIYAVTQVYLGKKPNVQECFAKTSRRLGALVVTGLVQILFQVFTSVGAGGIVLASMLALNSGSGMAILCLLLPFVVWGFFYFALALPLLAPAIIVEQQPVFETVRRVLYLASGYRNVVFWYGSTLALIFGLLTAILGTVVGPFTLLGLFSLLPITEAVFYLDARCAKGALSAETLARETGAYFVAQETGVYFAHETGAHFDHETGAHFDHYKQW